MDVNVNDINSQNWSLSIDDQNNIVEGLSDIDQCIRIILTTIPGTDPLRPGFGCPLHVYVDQPSSIAIPNMIREIGTSIELYEPRAEIINITVQQIEAQVIFSIFWTSSYGENMTTHEVNL